MTLRCGRCFRNLETPWGRTLHRVFPDGSMRCYAAEGREAWRGGGHVEVDYTSTRVVLDTKERTEMVQRLAEVWPQ